jgi:hypothetical protein
VTNKRGIDIYIQSECEVQQNVMGRVLHNRSYRRQAETEAEMMSNDMYTNILQWADAFQLYAVVP